MTDEQRGDLVPIFIDNQRHEIRKGAETVAAIKNLGGVPAADQLNEIIEGKLVALPDDGTVDVKAGDRFISQARTGGSS